MRDNFERFRGFIYWNIVKHRINKFLYPYVTVAMYNDLEEIYIRYECIMTPERIEGYNFVLDFIYEKTPAWL